MTTREVLTVRTAPEAWTVPRADQAIAAQLSGIERLGVAFSGGVDSSVLLALAARVAGHRTAWSPSWASPRAWPPTSARPPTRWRGRSACRWSR